MSFKYLFVILMLFYVNTYGQAVSTDTSLSSFALATDSLQTDSTKKDTVITPRNFFSEINFPFFDNDPSRKSVLKYIQPKKTDHSLLLFSILCILCCIAVYIKYQYQKELEEIAKYVFGVSTSLQKEMTLNKIFLSINYHITTIFLLYFLIKINLKTIPYSDYYLMFVIAVSFVGIGFARYLLLNLLSNIFDMQEVYYSYQTTNNYINYMSGLILLPILFTEIYSHGKISHILLYIGFSVVLINILYKVFKNILPHTPLMIYNLFHFIIYFCGVEIFPYLILNKFFREQIF